MILLSISVLGFKNDVKADVESDFVIKDGVLISYTGNSEEVIIPEGVTTIGYQAFFNNETIKKVVIPEGVIVIKRDAFNRCVNLSEIEITESVEEISILSVLRTKWLEDQQKLNPFVVVNGILIDGEMVEGRVIIPNTVRSGYQYKNLSLKKSSINLKVKGTVKLRLNSYGSCKWSTSNSSVATVSKK